MNCRLRNEYEAIFCSNKVQCYLGSVSQVLCKPALRHDQLPVGLSAQFLEHCMGIADGMG